MLGILFSKVTRETNVNGYTKIRKNMPVIFTKHFLLAYFDFDRWVYD